MVVKVVNFQPLQNMSLSKVFLAQPIAHRRNR